MNYKHIFHAGNFADVIKHIVLIELIRSLTLKEKGFCYLDTHAGAGQYDLLSASAQKSNDYANGIAKIYSAKNPPTLIADYLSFIRTLNNNNPQLQYYPGSPYFAKQLLRPQDQMVLCELQENEYDSLKQLFRHDKQIAVHQTDGYQGLNAFLPPKERRGLILIDPPYEQPDELMMLVTKLAHAVERFATGIYAIWFPIKTRPPIERFYQQIQNKISQDCLAIEFSIYPEVIPTQLNGCGILLINPPWQIEQKLHESVSWLFDRLNINSGEFKIRR
jgi:23S rRNA (adenine2030-N6)-methyltransferase